MGGGETEEAMTMLVGCGHTSIGAARLSSTGGGTHIANEFKGKHGNGRAFALPCTACGTRETGVVCSICDVSKGLRSG